MKRMPVAVLVAAGLLLAPAITSSQSQRVIWTSEMSVNQGALDGLGQLLELLKASGLNIAPFQETLKRYKLHEEGGESLGIRLVDGDEGITFVPPRFLGMRPVLYGGRLVLVNDDFVHTVLGAEVIRDLTRQDFLSTPLLLRNTANTAVHELLHGLVSRTECFKGSRNEEEDLVGANLSNDISGRITIYLRLKNGEAAAAQRQYSKSVSDVSDKLKQHPGWQRCYDLLGVASSLPEIREASPSQIASAGPTGGATVGGAMTGAVDAYSLMSKKGARWTYGITIETGGQQSRGTYTVANEGEAQFAGLRAVRFSDKADMGSGVAEGGSGYKASSSDGVAFLGYEGGVGSVTVRILVQPPSMELPNSLAEGHAWEGKGGITRTVGGRMERTDYIVRGKIIGKERVSVSAGEFDAIKVDRITEYPSSGTRGASTEWWAPNVGPVRKVEVTPVDIFLRGSSTVRRLTELQSYSIPGSAPQPAAAAGSARPDPSQALRNLAGRWQGVTSGGQSFAWAIDENGRYESTYRQFGREVRRGGRIWVAGDGSIQWRSDTGQSGTLTVSREGSGGQVLQGTISGRAETFQASQTGVPATNRGGLAGVGDAESKGRIPNSGEASGVEGPHIASSGVTFTVDCRSMFGRLDVQTGSEALRVLERGNEGAVRALLQSGLDYALTQCADARRGIPKEARVSLDLLKASNGKSCCWITGNFRWDGTKWQWSDFRNDLPLSAMASQEIRAQTQLDPETGAKFSLKIKNRVGYRDAKGACEDWPDDPVTVLGEVARQVDLADRTIVNQLLTRGRAHAVTTCGKVPTNPLTILLYQSDFNVSDWQNVWTVKAIYDQKGVTPTQYSNKAEDEKSKKKITKRLDEEILARKIEGFTLAMDMNEAIRFLTSQIRSGTYAIVEVGALPEMKEKLPIVFDTSTSVGGIAIPIKQSTLFRTPTTGAMQLTFYESVLVQIAIAPLAEREVMIDAITKKYGRPSGQLPSTGTPEAMLFVTKGADTWVDKKTMLLFYEKAPTAFTIPGIPPRPLRLNLVYQDRKVHSLMLQRAAELSKRQEEQEKTRRSTLPKGY